MDRYISSMRFIRYRIFLQFVLICFLSILMWLPAIWTLVFPFFYQSRTRTHEHIHTHTYPHTHTLQFNIVLGTVFGGIHIQCGDVVYSYNSNFVSRVSPKICLFFFQLSTCYFKGCSSRNFMKRKRFSGNSYGSFDLHYSRK